MKENEENESNDNSVNENSQNEDFSLVEKDQLISTHERTNDSIIEYKKEMTTLYLIMTIEQEVQLEAHYVKK